MSTVGSNCGRHQRNVHPEANCRRLVVKNTKGEKLVGLFHETRSTDVVIICHGFQSTKDRIPMVKLAAAFERGGISAYRFDFAGNGESEGSFQYGNYRREVEDLRCVVMHFRQMNRVITTIIGHSKGGNVVLLYASKYNDVCTVVNISGRFYLDKGIDGRLGRDYMERIKKDGFIDVINRKGKFEYRVTQESLMDRLTTDTQAACGSIHRNCRVMTVHGSMDRVVPASDALEFARCIPNHELLIMEGADHEYTNHQNDLASALLQFVRSHMGRGTGPGNSMKPRM